MFTVCSTHKISGSSLSLQFNKPFISGALAVVTASILSFMGGVYKPVQAETIDFVIERFIMDPRAVGSLIVEAEPLIREAIVSQFSHSSNASEVRVIVLGNYRGETIPVLTTVVSRSQWQEMPHVASWTRYSNSSETLLVRLDDSNETNQRGRSEPSPVVQDSVTSIDPVVQVEEAFTEGRLTRREYQELIDALD
jgi:hypothetical protein